jgi:hypothetical protein
MSAYEGLWGAGGGVYYKGTVTHVRQQMPSGGINLMGRGDYDPWEALEVEWDVGGDAEGMDHVSPWEIEVEGVLLLHPHTFMGAGMSSVPICCQLHACMLL